MFTIIVLDCDSGYIRCHCYTIAKSSLVCRVKGQADIEHFSIFWDIVVLNGHIEGELTHMIIEWVETEVSEVTIVTKSYIWTECELVCACVSIMLCNFTGANL